MLSIDHQSDCFTKRFPVEHQSFNEKLPVIPLGLAIAQNPDIEDRLQESFKITLSDPLLPVRLMIPQKLRNPLVIGPRAVDGLDDSLITLNQLCSIHFGDKVDAPVSIVPGSREPRDGFPL